MPQRHVVVDGSNIATEGRSLPSLAQLDQAVREFLGEFPDDIVTVVVDASFAHRIDSAEVATFEEAEGAGEVVSPPAGAIGRGDAFLLRIADKTGATVLSNDSFQEFHGEHEWLFEVDRLIGGKPVPGVGWIFTPRTPVRGPKSREAVKEAKRKKRAESDDESASGLDLAASRGRGRGKKVERAIATATEEAVEPSEAKKRRRRKNGEPPSDPINEPLAFITFIAGHPLGSEVTGTVESFSSHGAFIDADGARCYVPLSAMGNPAPRSAREVLNRGDVQTFVIQALDPLRRGIELALPGFVKLAGAPTAETVEAETQPVLAADQVGLAPGRTSGAAPSAKRAAARRRPAVAPPLAEGEDRGDRPAIGARKAAPTARRTPALDKPPFVAGAPTAPSVEASTDDVTPPATPSRLTEAVPAPAKAARRRLAKKAAVADPGGGGTDPPGENVAAADTSEAATVAPKKSAARTGPAKRASSAKAPAKKVVAVHSATKAASIDMSPANRTPTKEGSAKKGAPAKMSTAKTPAAKTTRNAPAAKTPAAKTPAAKTTTRKAPAAQAAIKKAPAARASGRKASGRKVAADRVVAPAAEDSTPAPKRPRKVAATKAGGSSDDERS